MSGLRLPLREKQKSMSKSRNEIESIKPTYNPHRANTSFFFKLDTNTKIILMRVPHNV